MLIVDLICRSSHIFEGWFKDQQELEDQIEQGILSCPVCGDTVISRLPSTFGIGRSKAPAERAESSGAEAGALSPEEQQAAKAVFMHRLENLSNKLREDFADVGGSFTAEALKMHYGAAPRRNIRGMSTEREEEILRSEGIEFFKVPMLVRKSPAAS